MEIKFRDVGGNVVTAVDLGMGSSVLLSVTIEGTDSTVALSGDILRNNAKIGTVSWDVGVGSSEVWYVGLDKPVPVQNGDVIKAVITSPIALESQVVVARFQPNLDAAIKSGSVTKLLRPGLPVATKQKLVIPTAVRTVLPYIENLGQLYNNRFAANVALLRKYFAGTLELETIQAQAYYSTADVTSALARLTPPTFKQIFDTWTRILGNAYFPFGTTPTGDAAAWYWSDALNSAVQPNNTALYAAFVSDEKPTTYDLETTLKSDNGDNDFNSVVMAFYRDPNTNLNHTLDVVVNRTGAVWGGNIDPNQYVAINFGAMTAAPNARFKVLKFVTLPGDVVGPGWSGTFKRVKVSRRGDNFTVLVSRWGETAYDPTSKMTFNLNDDPLMAVFKGGSAFGYGSMSQPVSYFKDVVIKTGLQRNLILDMRLNQVYQYIDSSWVLIPGLSVNSVYGSPRKIISYETGAQYHLNVDGTITAL